MSAHTFGIIAEGKPLSNITVTAFADWQDYALLAMSNEKKKTNNVEPFVQHNLHRRLASDGATDIRLFPVHIQ